MKEILLLYLFTVMAAAIKQANIERSSCDETVLSDTSLDAILKECIEIQKDAEFLNRSDDLRQVMKHHSTRCMGAEACRCGVYSFLEAKSLKSALLAESTSVPVKPDAITVKPDAITV